MIRLAIAGATGRTGRCVLEAAVKDVRFDVAAALVAPGRLGPGEPAASRSVYCGDTSVPLAEKLETPCDALIDFTTASGTMAWLDECVQRSLPMVIGTTGHTDDEFARIKQGARQVPILRAANFSVGINVIQSLLGRLIGQLGEAYDIEIVETHHREKVDAPSGTALTLLDEILKATGLSRDDNVLFGRGLVTHPPSDGKRPAQPSRDRKGADHHGAIKQIGVHSLRLGDTVSRHDIHFSGQGETITIQHTAHSFETFAGGALRAAAWLIDKKPGFYTMRDVIA